jgi:hypothetical protein
MRVFNCQLCGRSLDGYAPQAKFCSRRCGWWNSSRPDVPLPQGRTCEGCGANIDHLNLRARTCCSACQRWKFNNPGTLRPVEKTCATCSTSLVGKRADAQFCSASCRDASPANAMRYRDKSKLRRARIKSGQRGEPVRAEAVLDRDGWMCGLCGESIDGSVRWPDPASPSIDHITPVSRGGSHSMANLQAAHLGCNSRKGVGHAVARPGA